MKLQYNFGDVPYEYEINEQQVTECLLAIGAIKYEYELDYYEGGTVNPKDYEDCLEREFEYKAREQYREELTANNRGVSRRFD